jgi:hypothetical protein
VIPTFVTVAAAADNIDAGAPTTPVPRGEGFGGVDDIPCAVGGERGDVDKGDRLPETEAGPDPLDDGTCPPPDAPGIDTGVTVDRGAWELEEPGNEAPVNVGPDKVEDEEGTESRYQHPEYVRATS